MVPDSFISNILRELEKKSWEDSSLDYNTAKVVSYLSLAVIDMAHKLLYYSQYKFLRNSNFNVYDLDMEVVHIQ